MSTGSGKQQSQHLAILKEMPVPRLEERQETEIADLVQQATECYDLALKLEDDAFEMVESSNEEAS